MRLTVIAIGLALIACGDRMRARAVGDGGGRRSGRVAQALAQIGKEDLLHLLLDQLEREGEEAVQLEILKAVELVDG